MGVGVDDLFGVGGHGGILSFQHKGHKEKTPRDVYRSFIFLGCKFEIRTAMAGLILADRTHQ